MKVKIFYALLFSIIFTAFIPSGSEVSAYESVYTLMAYDYFDYEISGGTTVPLNTYKPNGGAGWEWGWSSKADSYTVPPNNGGMPCFQVINNRVTISNYLHTVPLYRTLTQAIDFSVDADYYVTASVFAASTNDANKQASDYRFMIGGTDLYFGYKYDSEDLTKLIPQLGVNNDVIYGEQQKDAYTYNDLVFYKYVMNISNNADGSDTIRVKMFKEGTDEPAEWDIEHTTELGTGTRDYIGFVPATSASHSTRTRDIVIEKYDRKLLNELTDVINNISADAATEDNCVRAFEILSDYPAGTEKDNMLLLLREFVTSKGWQDDVLHSEIKGITPQPSEKIYAENLTKVTIEFNYLPKKDSGAFFVYDDAGDDVSCNCAYDKNIVTLTFLEDAKVNTTYSVVANNLVDYKDDSISVNFAIKTSAVPVVNVVEGGEYRQYEKILWQDTNGIEVKATLQKDGDTTFSYENGTEIKDAGNYTLTLYAMVDGNEAPDTRSIHFTILPANPPVAENVKIIRDAQADEILIGMYDFSVIGNETESGSTYRWFRCASETGEYSVIEQAESKTYTLTEQDDNMYIVFEVTPKSNATTLNEGQPVKSMPFAGAFKPYAENVTLLGEMILGQELTVSFDYIDKNGDEAAEHLYNWYVSDTLDGALSKLDQVTGNKLEITEQLIGKYVCVGVIPVSSKKPYHGSEMLSNKILGPVAPVVSDVEIRGSAKVGNTLSGYYSFSDANLDEEGSSVLVWRNADTGAVLGQGATLLLTSNMQGEQIVFSVTGKSVNPPYASIEMTSDSVVINESKSQSTGGGFAYSGSNLGSKAQNAVVSPSQPNKENAVVSPSQPNKENAEMVFLDISEHWAKAYIERLKKDNIVSGVGENLFEPNRSVNRCEFISMLLRSFEIQPVQYEGAFEDVNVSDWFAGYIQQALNHNIISKDLKFRPNDEITREEATKAIAKIAKIEKSFELNYIDKEDISPWATEFVEAVTATGLMKGDDLGAFLPKKAMSRAEAATIIYRLRYEGGADND